MSESKLITLGPCQFSISVLATVELDEVAEGVPEHLVHHGTILKRFVFEK